MECRTCDHLSAPTRSHKQPLCTASKREETARQLAFEEADRLRRVSLDTDDALRAHRRQDHLDFTKSRRE
jgi:hypothetical protein